MGQTAQVKVQLDSEAKLNAILEYSRRTAEATEKTTQLRSSMQKLGEMGKLGAVFGAAGLSVGSLAQGFNEAKSSASVMAAEIARASGRVGVSAEAYQVMGNILKGAGGQAEDAAEAFKVLRNSLGEALRDQEGSPAKAFREINESASELSRLRPEQAMERIAKALARVEDPARRAAIAQDLMGKGATNIAPLLDRLATDGYSNLRDEVARTAGIMSGDMAKALDDATNRTENAANRMTVALAPLQRQAAETKATLTELFAELADTKLSVGWGTAAVGALGAGAAIGGGSPAAWGMVAGAMAAKAAAMTLPAWAGVGALIAGGFVAALAIKGIAASTIARLDEDADRALAPLARAEQFRKQLEKANDPAEVSRIQQEAARRMVEIQGRLNAKETVRITGQGGTQNITANSVGGEERKNLEEALKLYEGTARAAEQRGAAIVAGNKMMAENTANAQAAADAAATEAARDKEAYDWMVKKGNAQAAQTAEQRRAFEVSQLDPDQQLIVLNMERESLLAKHEKFKLTATGYEIEKAETELGDKLLTIEKESAAAEKAKAAAAEKTQKAKDETAESEQKSFEWQQKQALLRQEADIDKDMRDMAGQNARNQASLGLTAEEKRQLNIKALEAQRDYLLGAAQDLRKNGGDDERKRANQYTDRAAGLNSDLEAAKAGTPATAMQGLEAGFTALQDRWGTFSQQIQNSTVKIGEAITDSIGGALNQVLGTTEYWSQQLGSIAGPIMASITQSIATMFAQWVTARAAASMKNILFSAKEGAADAAAKAPGALMSSITSFGAAAAIGVAAFIAAKALSGGFAVGGYTGGTDSSAPAGVVHEGEWVAPKWMVDNPRYAKLIGTLEAARRGEPGFKLGGFLGQVQRTFFNPLHPGESIKQLWDTTIHPPGQGALKKSIYGSDAESTSASYDYGSQQWVKSPSQSFDMPAALAPLAVAMSGQRSDAASNDQPWVPQQQVVIVDFRDQELVARVISDPRFKSKVLQIGRGNPGAFGSPT